MNLTDEYEDISEYFWLFMQKQPDKNILFESHYQKTFENAVFDTKIKRLMAMCGAIVMGCRGCILGQTIKAIEAGATPEEVMEACSVMMSLGGTMAGSKIAIVMKILREKEMID